MKNDSTNKRNELSAQDFLSGVALGRTFVVNMMKTISLHSIQKLMKTNQQLSDEIILNVIIGEQALNDKHRVS
jgi:hypothetical protein